jgi:hypothetical protein
MASRILCPILLLLIATGSGFAQDISPDEKKAGFVSLFNGKDLTGWTYMGKGEGTFSVKDGSIHYKGGGGWLLLHREGISGFRDAL